MNITKKLFMAVTCAALAWAATSCADGVELESYDSGVRNQQLSAPQLDASCFTTQNSTDATYTIMSWPVVYGAGGYLVNVDIVDDPSNPIAVVNDSIVDGCSLRFVQQEDTKYQITIQTMANEKLGNTASEVLVYNDYTTLVAAIIVPRGQDLAAFVKANLKTGTQDVQAFELEAGATYEVGDTIAFGLQPVQLRSDKNSHATIVLKDKACITTQAPLTVKFLNFDCENTTAAPISLDPNPDASLYYDQPVWQAKYGGNQKVYFLDGDIILKDCIFREVKGMFFSGSKANWALTNLNINSCIVEGDYSTNEAFISMYGASTGTILNLIISNTTFYNLQENSSGYFLRLSNASNATPTKIYGPTGRGSVTVLNTTFVRMLTGTHWWNNYPQSGITFTMKRNIFYDTWLLQKAIRNNTADFSASDNVIWGVTNEVDATDKAKYATEEDPGFSVPTSSAINFNDPYYGLKSYFTPTKGIAASRQYGDPRYFE
jgi:hypothetical protein